MSFTGFEIDTQIPVVVARSGAFLLAQEGPDGDVPVGTAQWGVDSNGNAYFDANGHTAGDECVFGWAPDFAWPAASLSTRDAGDGGDGDFSIALDELVGGHYAAYAAQPVKRSARSRVYASYETPRVLQTRPDGSHYAAYR